MKQISSFLLLLVIAASAAGQSSKVPSKGFAATGSDNHFKPFEFTRHAVGENDIQIEILYAGICHSDVHAWENPPQNGQSIVPGHEIVGRVTKVGSKVTKFKVGEYAGVGCMVNSCGECEYCKADKEQFCTKGTVFTYGIADQYHNGEITRGGYSNNIVLTEKFAIKVAAGADIKKVAPLLCAGVTTWSPIHFSKVQKGDKVAVAGFGGLGHMAVKYLVDLGANVTIFDITEEKRALAKQLGASNYVNVKDSAQLAGLNNSYKFIISTIPNDYDATMYVKMLKMGGELAIVGLPKNSNINITSLVWSENRKVYGSLIGGIKETQEMLDYSIAHKIYPDVEFINANGEAIDKAYQNVIDGKVKFRYVIDMSTIK